MKIDEKTENAEVIDFEEKWIQENPGMSWTRNLPTLDRSGLDPLYWGTGSRSYPEKLNFYW